MRCYYHHQAEAVGICKNCLRGVCPTCGVDLGEGLACRGRCEEQVRTRIALTAPDLSRSRQRSGALFSGAMGLGMAIYASSLSQGGSTTGALLFALFAVIFFANACYIVYTSRVRASQ